MKNGTYQFWSPLLMTQQAKTSFSLTDHSSRFSLPKNQDENIKDQSLEYAAQFFWLLHVLFCSHEALPGTEKTHFQCFQDQLFSDSPKFSFAKPSMMFCPTQHSHFAPQPQLYERTMKRTVSKLLNQSVGDWETFYFLLWCDPMRQYYTFA